LRWQITPVLLCSVSLCPGHGLSGALLGVIRFERSLSPVASCVVTRQVFLLLIPLFLNFCGHQWTTRQCGLEVLVK
jgi:hypothetical protein